MITLTTADAVCYIYKQPDTIYFVWKPVNQCPIANVSRVEVAFAYDLVRRKCPTSI